MRRQLHREGPGADGTLLCLAGVAAALGMLWWRSRPHSAGIMLRHIALLAACLATIAIQAVFQRSGPPVTAQDWTYPSGHAVFVTSTALTTVAIVAALRGSRLAAVTVVAACAVVAVSVSRMVLGEHYLVDVVAAVGGTIGVGLLAAAALRLLPIGRGRNRRPAS